MATERKVITADEMDRMTPQERADAVDGGLVRDWSAVNAAFREQVEERARQLANQHGVDA